MVISHLIHDTHSLLTCSLTSRSLYLATVRHLHSTLVTHTRRSNGKDKTQWPKPLLMASKLGFLPIVRELFISGGSLDDERFCAKRLPLLAQREFSTLTNVRQLSIDNLDIPSFMPRIQKYFGQFSPTLQSLTLKKPQGSCQQILLFIGLFPHLEDLGLHFDWANLRREPDNNLKLTPSSSPPLRGRLTASCCFRSDNFARAMIDLFGGVRFRHMDLVHMGGTQLLLGACADTLETLKLDATDICGEHLHSNKRRVPAHNFAGRTRRGFDLSQNGSLQTLEIAAKSLIGVLSRRTPATAPGSFKTMLSTVKSPAFSDVFFVYREGDFYNDRCPKNARDEGIWYRRQFEVFRKILDVGGFRLTALVRREGDDPMGSCFVPRRWQGRRDWFSIPIFHAAGRVGTRRKIW